MSAETVRVGLDHEYMEGALGTHNTGLLNGRCAERTTEDQVRVLSRWAPDEAAAKCIVWRYADADSAPSTKYQSPPKFAAERTPLHDVSV